MATETKCPKCGGMMEVECPDDYPKAWYECWDCKFCMSAIKTLEHDSRTAGWEPDDRTTWWATHNHQPIHVIDVKLTHNTPMDDRTTGKFTVENVPLGVAVRIEVCYTSAPNYNCIEDVWQHEKEQ